MAGAWVSKKTSVTWLREICTRFHGVETYNYYETTSPGRTNEPYFQCRCILKFEGKEYEEKGTGRTKKEAKREAAQAMLNAMEDFAPKELNEMNYDRAKVNLDSGNKDLDDRSNPVSRLQELCIKIRHPQPIYRVDEEFGLPHERLFKIACHVGNEFVQYSSAASKKIAKREAAKQMETFLESLGVKIMKTPIFNEDDDEIIKNIKTAKNSYKKMMAGDKNGGDVPFGNLGCPYKGVPGPELEKLKTDPEFTPESPIAFLRDLGKEQNFGIDYTEFEEKSTDDKYQCLVQLSLEPVAMLKGEGLTSHDAKLDATLDAINFIRRMMVIVV